MSDEAAIIATNSQWSTNRTFWLGLCSGAVAGTLVDTILYPLDTIKTRLQAKPGMIKTPLFSSLYRGIVPAIAASAPCGAVFFATYDISKHLLFQSSWYEKRIGALDGSSNVVFTNTMVHMMAAATGDMTSSLVRAPFEMLKQRMQAGIVSSHSLSSMANVVRSAGLTALLAGYTSLMLRELPFDLIEYPLYEFLKHKARADAGGAESSIWTMSLCGMIAGGFSASVTTPLDVAKTRVMLESTAAPSAALPSQAVPEPVRQSVIKTLARISRQEGLAGLFSGVVPRTLWISLGGAIFFGAYEGTKHSLSLIF